MPPACPDARLPGAPARLTAGDGPPRVALLTNILPPYRIPFLNELARRVELHVVVNALSTPDRSWRIDTRELRFELVVEGGVTRRVQRAGAAGHRETRYQHLANRTVPMLRRIRPDVIVSAELGLRTAQALGYARLHRIPSIVFWEGTAHTEARISAVRRVWRRLLLRSADAAWVNGVESQAYLESLGFSPSRITSHMTGVDTEYFRRAADAARHSRWRRREALGLRGLVFAVSGTLSSRKGIVQLLAAFERLAAMAPEREFSVLFIGDGEERARIEAWGRAHPGIGVHVTGFRQLEELPALCACADWGVLPTLEDCWALVTIEMVACGLPQVLSRYAGASVDLLAFPGTGVLADPLDPARFAQALGDAAAQGPRTLPTSTVDAVAERYGADALAERATRSIDRLIQARGVASAA